MKNTASFYKSVIVAFLLLTLFGCKGEGRYGEESGSTQATETVSTGNVDPLELPQDTRVVPQLVPKRGDIKGVANKADTAGETTNNSTTTTTTTTTANTAQMDTLVSQALRIQILATELFGDAKKEQRIAEEIFDQPVYMDYEVPYYKVRVGGFADRKDAEAYLSKVKSAGYTNSWVVAVRVNTKEAVSQYKDLPAPKSDSVKGN